MKTIRTITCLTWILVWGAGCASVSTPTRPTTATTPSNPEPIVTMLTQTGVSWDGQPLPAYPDGPPQISVLHIVIPAGTTLAMHRHPMINVGYLLSGELTVVANNGQTLRLQAGESIVEVVNTWHYGRNDGSIPAEIVVVYAGTEGLPLSEHK